MEIKRIDIEGKKLAYAEKNPSQNYTIFFINSNSSSLLWRHQFTSSLFDNYRLIAIELPGHGQSEKTNDPAVDFSIWGSAFLLSTAIKILAGNNSYTLIGFSYGTNLVAEILEFGVKPSGIVLISSSITGKNFEIDKIIRPGVLNIYLNEKNTAAEIQTFYDVHLLSTTEDDKQIYISDFMAVQPQFRSTVLECVSQGNYADEIVLLNKVSVPLLVIWGVSDRLINIEYLNTAPLNLWNDQSYTFAQCGHFVITDQPDLLNKMIKKYLDKI